MASTTRNAHNTAALSQDPPRASTETDRKHLLAPSLAPSETSSLHTTTAGSRTPRASSPALHTRHASLALSSPASSDHQEPYRGYPSRAHYLAALQSWADEKKYLEPQDTGTGLKGFFGETTMQEYAARPGVVGGLGLRRKWRERKGRKDEAGGGESERVGRRGTVT